MFDTNSHELIRYANKKEEKATLLAETYLSLFHAQSTFCVLTATVKVAKVINTPQNPF